MNMQHESNSPKQSQVNAFVRGLPDVDRKILMLHYAENLEAHEVAGVLGLNLIQVETRITALRTVARAVVDGVGLSRAG